MLNSHPFNGKAGEISMCYGGRPRINIRLCDQGGSKPICRMMQNRLERDNESCWSKTVESTDTGMGCKPVEQDYNQDDLQMGRPQYSVGFPGFRRDRTPAVTELKGEAWKVPAFFTRQNRGGIRPWTSDNFAKVILWS